MMLLPGLRDLPESGVGNKLALLNAVLCNCREVVFADLNLPLNLLWVSVRARPGVIVELASAIMTCLPEARLVGDGSAR